MSDQQINRHTGAQQVSLKMLEKISLFKKTENLFLYKKSERLLNAVFAVSDSIVSDTLREQVRNESLKLFTGVRDAIAARGSINISDGGKLSLLALSIAALFEVACRLGEVSEGNYGLLKAELAKLAESLGQVQEDADSLIDRRILEDGLMLDKRRSAPRFSAITRRDNQESGPETIATAGREMAGSRAELSRSLPKTFMAGLSDKTNISQDYIKDRESIVLDVVRKRGKVSIKDVLSEMPLIGEKTVQRTLSSLVSKGSLKKFGDRRWSRYEVATSGNSVQ